jgi:hypothetical protein
MNKKAAPFGAAFLIADIKDQAVGAFDLAA